MTSEQKVTTVLSAFVPESDADAVKKSFGKFVGKWRNISIDQRALEFTIGYAVVQVYSHFRVGEKEELPTRLDEQKRLFCEMESVVREEVSPDEFFAFAQYWFCESKVLEPSDLVSKTSDQPVTSRKVQGILESGGRADLQFVARPCPSESFARSVTIIEVEDETNEDLAVALAFLESNPFDAPLCILDLLAAKGCWLQRNITHNTSSASDQEGDFIEKTLSQSLSSAEKLLSESFDERPSPQTCLRLARLISKAAVVIAALKMNAPMLAAVESQLLSANKIFSDGSLLPRLEAKGQVLFPVHHALQGIRKTVQLGLKYIPLFEGIVDGMTAVERYSNAVNLEDSAKRERAITRRFNLQSILLAGVGIGVSTAAIVDNEIAKSLITYLSADANGQPSMLSVVIVKVVFVLLAGGLVSLGVARIALQKSEESHG